MQEPRMLDIEIVEKHFSNYPNMRHKNTKNVLLLQNE